jgi:preprotein translocase subunit Sec61beta
MGIRHLKDRSPRTTVIIGAAIASLVLLAFVLQLVHG